MKFWALASGAPHQCHVASRAVWGRTIHLPTHLLTQNPLGDFALCGLTGTNLRLVLRENSKTVQNSFWLKSRMVTVGSPVLTPLPQSHSEICKRDMGHQHTQGTGFLAFTHGAHSTGNVPSSRDSWSWGTAPSFLQLRETEVPRGNTPQPMSHTWAETKQKHRAPSFNLP